jgi:hypothetical protein
MFYVSLQLDAVAKTWGVYLKSDDSLVEGGFFSEVGAEAAMFELEHPEGDGVRP